MERRREEGASLDIRVHFETREHVFGRYFLFGGGMWGVGGPPSPLQHTILFVCVVNPGAAAGPRV